MNKAELVEVVAEAAELSRKDAGNAVEEVFAAIEAALKKGEAVKISGFGNFEVKARAARTGTNPATGKAIKIEASKTVGFKLSKNLKEKLN